MTSLDQNLEQYFNELIAWRDMQLVSPDASSNDRLAIISLRIATWLLDEQGLGKTIAKELSLIAEVPERPDAEEELLGAIHAIEHDLDANLRGFSGFMEWILEEAQIRRDPTAALKSVPNLDPRLASSFDRMTRTLEAYLELEEAFALSAPRAAAVIFLVAFGDVYRQLIAMEAEQSHLIVGDWVTERIKKDALRGLYQTSVQLIEQSWPKEDCSLLTKDLIVVLLCFRAADWHMVSSDEVSLVDRSLHSIGMIGIKPLLEAGFLHLEESARNNDLIDCKSGKVLQAT